MTTLDPVQVATGPGDLDEQIALDVARLAQLSREIDERKETADAIKARLREQLTPGRRYRWQGRDVLDLGRPGTTFDAKRATSLVPEPLLAQISRPRPDADLARRILPDELYAQCCSARVPSVRAL